MNDFITISIFWVLVGAVWTYFSDKRAYKEGMLDAIVMHNRGQLTYTSYFDDDGLEMIDMQVSPDED